MYYYVLELIFEIVLYFNLSFIPLHHVANMPHLIIHSCLFKLGIEAFHHIHMFIIHFFIPM